MNADRILVLGGSGMLGHKVTQIVARTFPDTWCTLRDEAAVDHFGRYLPLPKDNVLALDAFDDAALESLLLRVKPSVVVNCIGVVKQKEEAQNPILTLTLNSVLPHKIAALIGQWRARMIHFSTDCVFSGSKGNYSEEDTADATDLYGRSKLLGEVTTANALTLRTSMIGRELYSHRSLLDWFLMQSSPSVPGYKSARWNGVTTNHLAELVVHIISEHPGLAGLYHLGGPQLSKFELLTMIKAAYGLETAIVPDESLVLDRTLNSARLSNAMGYSCPPWTELLRELLSDPTPYDLGPQPSARH
jgi:dTDP-4-dehydrorhamnose reductase